MQSYWLKKENSSSLLIFFTGWGMKPASTGHLKITNHDLLVIYDYREMHVDELKISGNYNDIMIVAWSMGVLAAAYIMQEAALKPTLAIAINGTGVPISDQYGIPVDIYTGTTQTLSDHSLKKFLLRMCGSKTGYDKFMENHVIADIPSLKDELIAIEKKQHDYSFKQKWDHAILCQNDSIFPYANMYAYWDGKVQDIISIQAPHFPFFIWDSWTSIIDFCKEKKDGKGFN